MAFTSGLKYAGADRSHNIEINVKGTARHLPLYNLPGDDYKRNKGDLWIYDFSQFGFGCVKIQDIDYVEITEGSNDGWNIASIVTLVEGARGGTQALTADLSVNRWVDGNGEPSERYFKLTKL